MGKEESAISMAHVIKNNKCFVFMKKGDAGPGPGPEKTTNARQERAKKHARLGRHSYMAKGPSTCSPILQQWLCKHFDKEVRDNVFCLTWQVFLSSWGRKKLSVITAR